MREGCKSLPTLFLRRYCVAAKDWIFLVHSHGPRLDRWGKIIMQWTAPAFEEVCLNCEINSYASAKL